MISKLIGTFFKKDIKSKITWAKLALALILSNIAFFLLFSPEQSSLEEFQPAAGWVEIQLNAQSMTPFQKGKKIILINQSKNLLIEGILSVEVIPEAKYIAWVPENKAQNIFQHSLGWEILPYLKDLKLSKNIKRELHEIRY